MKGTSSLAFRIALWFSALVAILLAAVIVITEFRIRSDIGGFTRAENLQITEARADQVGALLDKILWQTHMIAERPEFRGMESDPAKSKAAILSLAGKLSSEVVGCFVAGRDGNYISTDDKTGNVADRDYFAKVVGEGQASFIGAPVISKSLGIPIVVIAVAVKGEDGSTKGLIGSQLALSNLSAITDDIRVGVSGYGTIADQTGLIIADRNRDAIMKLNVTDADKDGYRGLDELGKRMIAEESGSGSFLTPEGVNVTTYYTRIAQSPGWVLGINISSAEVNKITSELTFLLIVLLAVGILVTVGLSMAIGRATVSALKKAADGFRQLAEGDADLTIELPVKTKDEVGELLTNFNTFIARLRQIVSSLKHSQAEMGTISAGLDGSVKETHAAVADMSANIDRVQDQSRQQADSVNESSTAVEEIAKNIESLDHLINDQAASIIEASASIEEMVGNIAAIGDSTDRMASQFDNLSTAANEGKNTQSLAMQKITQIAERSAGLMAANKVIADIASQTNLLAMNAAIEAAHAGDSGKGFSVVAGEIRRLAETSADQSRTISNELTRVQAAINEVVISSKNSEEAFDRVTTRISETDAIVRSVRQAMAEQEEGSTQILQALKAMNEVTSQVRLGSGEMKSGNQTILAEIQRLKSSTQDISRTMETLVQSVQEITTSSVQVGKMAESTASTVGDMEGVIGRFKV